MKFPCAVVKSMDVFSLESSRYNTTPLATWGSSVTLPNRPRPPNRRMGCVEAVHEFPRSASVPSKRHGSMEAMWPPRAAADPSHFTSARSVSPKITRTPTAALRVEGEKSEQESSFHRVRILSKCVTQIIRPAERRRMRLRKVFQNRHDQTGSECNRLWSA